MNIQSLSAAPFNLDAAAIQWVQKTVNGLSTEQRIRQVINEASMSDDLNAAQSIGGYQLGGVTRFMGTDVQAAWQATRVLIEASEIPLLISGDIEGGGIGLGCATPVPNPLGLAAADSVLINDAVASMMAREARALGINWAFAPVIDINARFRSAIVSTRSYGSDPARILRMASGYVKSFQAEGIAATAKHWPGEGLDDRDQHLVTTVNRLDMNAWRECFGVLYRSLIADGVKCVMSAHIALPAWARACGAKGMEVYRPASVSQHLNLGLLRGTLGFNGLIVSDAAPMAGLTSWADRKEYVPQVIESGCDMLLFSLSLEEDLGHLRSALRDGRLSEERLDAAVMRVLGLKASLGLHTKTIDELLPPLDIVSTRLRTPQNEGIAAEAASASITLVKDVKNTLPLSLSKHRRIVLVTDPEHVGFINDAGPNKQLLSDLLTERGFEVRKYAADSPPTVADTDLVLYLLTQESMLTAANIYLSWRRMHGNPVAAMSRHWHELPCILVSLGQPYYLYDAPRMPCVINAYSAIESVQYALVRKLLGDEPFLGVSPVDAFCGLPEAVY